MTFGGMTDVMKALGAYWFEIVELPSDVEKFDEQNSAEGSPDR